MFTSLVRIQGIKETYIRTVYFTQYMTGMFGKNLCLPRKFIFIDTVCCIMIYGTVKIWVIRIDLGTPAFDGSLHEKKLTHRQKEESKMKEVIDNYCREKKHRYFNSLA